MEENRLKPMVDNYDVKVFNQIYYETEGLRKKLTNQIDPRKFRVDSDEVLSWFSVKFIHAFNRYYGTCSNDKLKGVIIGSLQNFKYRILRNSYTKKNSQEYISTELINLESELIEQEEFPIDYYQNLINYLKGQISDNAISLLEIQLNPPPYILRRLEKRDIHNIYKIPDDLILKYFDLEVCDRSLKYLASLRKEIKYATNKAVAYFRNN